MKAVLPIVAVLLVITLMAAGYFAGLKDGREAGAAEVRELWDEQLKTQLRAAADEEARHRETERQAREALRIQEEAHASYVERARAADAVLRRELDGLRNALKARQSGPGGGELSQAPDAAQLDAGATAAGLLGECAGQLVELAGQANRLGDQLRAFQALSPQK